MDWELKTMVRAFLKATACIVIICLLTMNAGTLITAFKNCHQDIQLLISMIVVPPVGILIVDHFSKQSAQRFDDRVKRENPNGISARAMYFRYFY